MTVQAIETSVNVYRALLRLYPAEHREEYGPHMLQVFRDCCRDAYRQARGAGLQELWLSTLGDLLKSALEERTRGGIRMSQQGFVRLGQLAAVLGGVGWTLTFLIMGTRPPGDARGEGLTGLQFACVLLFMLASLGHALSRTPREGRVLAAGAALVVAAGSLVALSVLALWGWGGDMPESVWNVAYISFMTLCAGHALSGLDIARTPALRLPGLLLAASAPLVPFMDTRNDFVWLGLPMGLAWLTYGLFSLRRPASGPAPRPA